MLRLLITHGEHLGESSVESKDRLGRTVLHLAAMHGCTNLVEELIEPESEGGFGAVLFALDIEGDLPIHLAIDYHRKGVF
jgi:ankyrin repeat protein